MKILILGGYGVFGGRLAELLRELANIEIYICGRNLEQATDFCVRYKGPAKVSPLGVDRNDLSDVLFKIKPDVLVDASGPFQFYDQNKNADPYTVIRDCIKAGVNYMDLADCADFVLGVPNFNVQAKAADVFILSGVSSYPVLTTAVLSDMAKHMKVHSVVGGIVPSPHTHFGLNNIRAIISYAGGPIKLQRDGEQQIAYGFTEHARFKIAPPGRAPLKDIHFSLMDVPDLQIIPKQIKSLQNIWMGVGPVSKFMHCLLKIMAHIRKKYSLRAFTSFSAVFQKILNIVNFGERRGGMFVKATGIKNARQVERTWHMIAEGEVASYIPSMAVEGIIRKILTGKKPKTGARVATKELTLKDYNFLFKDKPIYNGFRDLLDSSAPLYRNLLNTAYEDMPLAVQKLHGSNEPRVWSGAAEIIRSKNPLANIVALFFSFPKASKATPVSVTFTPQVDGSEKWERNFGGKKLRSIQRLGNGKNEHLLMEKFGLVEFAMVLVLENDKLLITPKSWTFIGIPMPKYLLPNGSAFEADKNGYFVFDVEIKAPILGLIVAYNGLLKED